MREFHFLLAQEGTMYFSCFGKSTGVLFLSARQKKYQKDRCFITSSRGCIYRLTRASVDATHHPVHATPPKIGHVQAVSLLNRVPTMILFQLCHHAFGYGFMLVIFAVGSRRSILLAKSKNWSAVRWSFRRWANNVRSWLYLRIWGAQAARLRISFRSFLVAYKKRTL